MFILLTLGIFLLKFLALGVVGLFLFEDLQLTQGVNGAIYTVYAIIGIIAFASLFFFVLGKKLLWLIIFGVTAVIYLGMYNGAPGIEEIHEQNDLKSRYFQDTGTFIGKMGEVLNIIKQNS